MTEQSLGAITITPWARPYSIGPSDGFLHAIGQIVANYSAVEWLIHLLFQTTLGEPELASLLVHELSINTGNEPNFIIARLRSGRYHRGASEHTIAAIERFKNMKQMRQRVVHWVGSVGNAVEQVGSFSNELKRRHGTPSPAVTYTLDELRSYALDLATIVRDLAEGLAVLQLAPGEASALLEASKKGTARPSDRLMELFART
jgi:hypothetical protein